ncbi:MAG: ATP-dependent zinc metalloprotease FtsH [Acidimicrobiia bacterium]|nr:ATP-dependent zinc metalloprotease FtsH [Acidimicrobiia bacterium]
MKRLFRSVVFWVVLVLTVALLGGWMLRGGESREDLTLSEFRNRLDAGQVTEVEMRDRDSVIHGELVDGTKFSTTYVQESGDELVAEIEATGEVEVTVNQQRESIWLGLLFNLLPVIILVAVFLFIINTMQGGGGRIMSFGKVRGRQVNKDQPTVTFADVAGADEAVEELREVKEFLEGPGRFQALGARIPKGVLLFGPPGTGKTLLARAVAGEAGVPFFSISGSDFVEMFVGVGASRVRDLFEQAKSTAPAIIFVDEIDAVGRHRGSGLGGGHDEREQTLNQLLVEMDGFDATSGVILIAATNRPDILDPALLRPGRFDRQIVVDRPDLAGRIGILEVHGKGKSLGADVSLDVVARRTPGFTGADLANLLNEAALLTARRDKSEIGIDEVEEAIYRVLAGTERRTRVMSEEEKKVIAYHEAGHALVGHVLPNTDPVHKVSIIARGRALGWTLYLPEADRHLNSKAELRDTMAATLGGRVAEEIIFGDVTSGAADDIDRVTQTARAMVMTLGMSDALGPQRFGAKEGDPFLGRDMGADPHYSDEVATLIDSEIRSLIDAAHAEAREILTLHRVTLDRLAETLIERETLDEAELNEIFADLDTWTTGRDPSARRPGPAFGGSQSPQTTSFDPPDPPRGTDV